MSVDQAEIEKIAQLARIRVAPSDIAELTERITGILDMVDQMQAVDTEGVEPLASPLNTSQRLREDQVTEPDRHVEFQAIAPATESDLYLVPKVID